MAQEEVVTCTTLVWKLLNAWDFIDENQESGGNCFAVGTEQMKPNHMRGPDPVMMPRGDVGRGMRRVTV